MTMDYEIHLHKVGLLNSLTKGVTPPFPLNKLYDEDSVGGDNFKGFMKILKRATLQLKRKLKDNEPVSDNFDMHLAFISKFAGDKFKYYPMVLDFKDGQQLIGLARQYGDRTTEMKLSRDEKIKITKWFLNGVEITKEVFTTKETVVNPSEEIASLAKIINTTSLRFKRYHLKELREEIKRKKQQLKALKAELETIPKETISNVNEKEELKDELKKDVLSASEPSERESEIYKFLDSNEFFKKEDELYKRMLAYSIDNNTIFHRNMTPIIKFLEDRGYRDAKKRGYYFKLKDDLTKEILSEIGNDNNSTATQPQEDISIDLNESPMSPNIRGKIVSNQITLRPRVGSKWTEAEVEKLAEWLTDLGLSPTIVGTTKVLAFGVNDFTAVVTKEDIKREKKKAELNKIEAEKKEKIDALHSKLDSSEFYEDVFNEPLLDGASENIKYYILAHVENTPKEEFEPMHFVGSPLIPFMEAKNLVPDDKDITVQESVEAIAKYIRENKDTSSNGNTITIDLNDAPTFPNIKETNYKGNMINTVISSRVGSSWSEEDFDKVVAWLKGLGVKDARRTMSKIVFAKGHTIIGVEGQDDDIDLNRHMNKKKQENNSLTKESNDNEMDMKDFEKILELKTIDDILTDDTKETLEALTSLYGKDKDKYEAIYKKIQSHLADIATKGA